jgi:nucleotide-binding universal stress UspA family protein
MLRSILVAIGDQTEDSAALEYAYVLSKAYKATLFGHLIIDVSEAGNKGLSLLKEGDFHIDTRQMLEDRGHELLDKFEAQCRQREIKSETEVVIGDYKREIFQRMLEVDLGILGVNERESSLSPVVDLAVRSSTKPVLLVRDEYRPIKKILVGFDKSALSGHCLQLGANLAEQIGAHLVLFTVAESIPDGQITLASGTRYLARYELEFTPILKSGDVVKEISDFVEQENCNLVIVGSRGHARFRELLFSSTTQRITQRVGCPVLVYH